MGFIALVLMLGAAIAGFLLDEGTWFFWLFAGAIGAQFVSVHQAFERWRRKE